jgi:hypothetical protein
MNKEQKRILHDYEKLVKKIFKQYIKNYEYKGSLNTIFKRMNDFFVHSVWFLKYIDGELNIVVWNYIKPYQYDTIFWKIFEMEDNINSSDSVRANGAFAFPSIKVSEKYFLIKDDIEMNITIQSVLEYMTSVYNEEIASIDNNVINFNQKVINETGYLREELIKMIANIQIGNYNNALSIVKKEISNNKRGGFINKDKDIYQYIKEYCEERINY